MNEVGLERCACPGGPTQHQPRRVVLTGGPGAGKTAVLEVVRRRFCDHVVVLPEAATIVFGGGFPRRPTSAARSRAQLAIFHVQDQLEGLALDESDARGTRPALVLCDRGVADGLAYWPGTADAYWRAVGTTPAEAFGRYDAVIHLRTPSAENGYHNGNPVRIESAEEAAHIDQRIAEVWSAHPRRFVVESTTDFVDKLQSTLAFIDALIPECCRIP
jgi:predicted ATPase